MRLFSEQTHIAAADGEKRAIAPPVHDERQPIDRGQPPPAATHDPSCPGGEPTPYAARRSSSRGHTKRRYV